MFVVVRSPRKAERNHEANQPPQVKLSDLVQIEAKDAEKPSIQAIEDNINQKYANKVFLPAALIITKAKT